MGYYLGVQPVGVGSVQSDHNPTVRVITCVYLLKLFWWLDGVKIFVVLGVGEGAVEWLDVAAHGPGGGADAMNLIPMPVFTEFNCCSIRKGLNNFHQTIYWYYYCKKGLL